MAYLCQMSQKYSGGTGAKCLKNTVGEHVPNVTKIQWGNRCQMSQKYSGGSIHVGLELVLAVGCFLDVTVLKRVTRHTSRITHHTPHAPPLSCHLRCHRCLLQPELRHRRISHCTVNYLSHLRALKLQQTQKISCNVRCTLQSVLRCFFLMTLRVSGTAGTSTAGAGAGAGAASAGVSAAAAVEAREGGGGG
jgi:hypothetical protein